MSNRAMAWAWGVDGLTTVQKLLLVALADFADEADSCYPGQERLAQLASTSRETVSRNLSRLEDLGLISRERRQRKDGFRTSDRFVLHVGVVVSRSRDDGESGAAASHESAPSTPDQRDAGSRDAGSRDAESCDSDAAPYVTQTGGQRSEPPVLTPRYPHSPPAGAIVDADIVDTAEPTAPVDAGLISPDDVDSTRADFDEFWLAYDNPVARKAAERAWSKAITRAPARLLVERAAAYRAWCERTGTPQANPATWLNGDRWLDELRERAPRGQPGIDFDELRRLDAAVAARDAGHPTARLRAVEGRPR